MQTDNIAAIRCPFIRLTSTSEHAGSHHLRPICYPTVLRAFDCMCRRVSSSNAVHNRPVILPNPGFRLLLMQVTPRMRLSLVFCFIVRGLLSFEQQEIALFGSSSVQGHALFVNAEEDMKMVASLTCLCGHFYCLLICRKLLIIRSQHMKMLEKTLLLHVLMPCVIIISNALKQKSVNRIVDNNDEHKRKACALQ